MHNHDFSILKRNINILIKEKGVTTQDKLGEIIGKSQSSVSKALSTDNKSAGFTVEQICRIADHFEISIDELLGREIRLSYEKICNTLITLLTVNKLQCLECSVNDLDKAVSYPAFYFPNHDTSNNAIQENIHMNKFMRKFIDAFQKFNNGDLENEEYEVLSKLFLKTFRKSLRGE